MRVLRSLLLVFGGGLALLDVQAAGTPPSATIKFLQERTKADPDDILAQNRLAEEAAQFARQTGDEAWLAVAVRAADQSLSAVPGNANPGGLVARSVVHLARHRFREAKTDAEEVHRVKPALVRYHELSGDACLELGELDLAAEHFATLLKESGESLGWHARMARLARARGDQATASHHYSGAVAFARDTQPPAPFWIAWALVQRGAYAFLRGDRDAAERDYQEALAADPAGWLALDHLGELRAAAGRWDDAVDFFQRAIAKSASPILRQALGDVLVAAKRPEEAKRWLDEAEARYLASTEAGEGFFAHQLASFYSDTRPNPAEAEKWARHDLELRRTPASLDGLAWALYRAGQFEPAAAAMREALASGGEAGADPHLLYHAGFILMRAGDVPRAQALLRRAQELDPAVGDFHVHR